MISKELLSEVLDVNIVEFVFMVDDALLLYKYHNGKNNKGATVNIYELAHKCKEWAKAQGYQIWSGHQCRGDIFACSVYVKDDYANDDDFVADTEPEAIFKACEWILNDRR